MSHQSICYFLNNGIYFLHAVQMYGELKLTMVSGLVFGGSKILTNRNNLLTCIKRNLLELNKISAKYIHMSFCFSEETYKIDMAYKLCPAASNKFHFLQSIYFNKITNLLDKFLHHNGRITFRKHRAFIYLS